MECIKELIYEVDYILNSKRKRHIAGGILLSIFALFGGLAVTVFTIRKGEDDYE